MGQILHQRATTTSVIRRKIQEEQGSINAIANKYGVSWNTAKKWNNRESTTDKPMGNGRSNSPLTGDEEVIICEVRKKTWLPLDDLLDHLKPMMPNLSRSALHRCLQYYGISKVPEELKAKKEKGKFRMYEIGFLHIDITEFWLAKKKWYLFVSIDRTSKMCYVELFPEKTAKNAVCFTKNTISFFPYKIHRILTDNGQQFTYRGMPKALRPKLKRHPFNTLLLENGIKHKLTKFYHPQTNGQVERMNGTIKESTLKKFHYDSIDQFSTSLATFINYYNFKKPLKALKRISPYDFVLIKWKKNPKLFNRDPTHHCVGLNI